jgi:predicted nucleotidyltransferase
VAIDDNPPAVDRVMGMKLRGLSEDDQTQLIPRNTILLGYRGSIAHGMYRNPEHQADAIDDKDLLGVCIAPLDTYFGLGHFEQKETMLREWDVVVYELQKFVRLLLQGNPNVLGLLWLEPHHYVTRTVLGDRLVAARDLFVGKHVYHAFTGYAFGQLKRMTHLAFKGYMGAKRKELVEKFGYDTKNAAHLIRLLRMGIEFLTEGRLYVHRPDAPQLMEIKLGGWSLEKVKAEAEALFAASRDAYINSKLPEQPDRQGASRLVVDMLRFQFDVAGTEP